MRNIAATIFFLLFGVLAATASPMTHAAGIVVPIGGALKGDNVEVWTRLVELAGGKESRFAVLAIASDEPERAAQRVIETLARYGAKGEFIPVSPRLKTPDVRTAVRDGDLLNKIASSNAIFFTGGAQERITDSLFEADGKATPMLDAIHALLARGGVVAGTSAGAAVMSATMFRDPKPMLALLKAGLTDKQDIDRGLGMVGNQMFIDQHFLKRGRIGRLIPALLHCHCRWGLGIDENTAAIIKDGTVEIIGAKGALLVDMAVASTSPALGAFNVRNVKLSYLDRGDRFDLNTRTMTASPAKREGKHLQPDSAHYQPQYQNTAFFADILGDTVIVHAMSRLMDSRARELTGLAFDPYENTPPRHLAFEFRLRKGPQSHAYYTEALGGDDYSIQDVLLDITPIRLASPLYRRWSGASTKPNGTMP